MASYTSIEIANIVQGHLVGNRNLSINFLVYDSRKQIIANNSLFIAIVGERHDGHEFIRQMFDKGVRAFLVSEIKETYTQLNEACFIKVENTVEALQRLAAHHRSVFKGKVVAITGSNGKTIVKEWLSQSLTLKYNIVRSPKSYNSQIGVPLSVWLLDNNSDWGVFEAGISKPAEMDNLEKVLEPDCGILTNIGEAHQQSFQNLEEKVLEKMELFKNCQQICYCKDHNLIHDLISARTDWVDKNIINWSMTESDATIQISLVEKTSLESSFEFTFNKSKYDIRIPFSDKASIENAMHVVCFLIVDGFSQSELNEAVKNLYPLAMRMEQVKGINGCTLVNDAYNSDVNALEIALDYINQLSKQKNVLILSDILQSGLGGKELYSRVAKLLEQRGIDLLIGIGKDIESNKELFRKTKAEFFYQTSDFLKSELASRFKNQTILIKGARDFHFEQIVSQLSEKNHTTLLESNLNKLTDNLNYFRSKLSSKTGIMVMVKALAYGSGGVEVAKLLQHEKVDYLGVAFTDEGVQLRQSGIHIPIMVMSPALEDFSRIIEYELEPEIYSIHVLRKFIEITEKEQVTNYPIHIKIDTGMHRLGFMEQDMSELFTLLKTTDRIRVHALFSHLAASDEEFHDEFTRSQIDMFKSVYKKAKTTLGYSPIRHILNSAGIERFPEAHYELVRLGIGLHGVSSVNDELKMVSTLKTHISQIKVIPEGDTVGYGRKGKVSNTKTIAILPVGYADGLDRKLGNGNGFVMLNGNKAFYLGSICMDMCMIDISNIKCSEGDEVIVFGENPSITELAEIINTIPYEILTNVSSRVKRVYLKD